MLTITQVKNGLLLEVKNKQDREDLKAYYYNGEDLWPNERNIWFDLLEPYSSNGQYYPVDPKNPDTFVGLTSDPYIISEFEDIEDNGKTVLSGKLWHCNNYCFDSVVEKLIEDGNYTLQEVVKCYNKQ